MMDQQPPPVRVSRDHFAKLTHRLRDRLPLWVIFAPGTFPQYGMQFVARMQISLPKSRHTRFVITHDTLDELRSVLPPGLYPFAREMNDHHSVIETWRVLPENSFVLLSSDANFLEIASMMGQANLATRH